MDIAFCGSCSHYELYGESRSSAGGQVKVRRIAKPKYCAKCGAEMRYGCSKCGKLRRSMEDKFCVDCGTSYK